MNPPSITKEDINRILDDAAQQHAEKDGNWLVYIINTAVAARDRQWGEHLANQDSKQPFGYVTVRHLSQRHPNHQDQYFFYKQAPYLDNVDECIPVYQMPQSSQEPVKFLANGTRFKMAFFDTDEDEIGNRGTYVTCFEGFEKELDGQWVALVAAEDDCHWQHMSTKPRKSE